MENILGIIGFIVGIVSLFLYLRDKYLNKVIPLVRYYNTVEVSKLSDSNRKIFVSYDNKEVPQVTTTSIWFWNKGKKPLKNEDIPSKEQLYFELFDIENTKKQIDILDYKIIKFSRNGSNVNLTRKEESNRLYLEFEYFDSKDGFCFDVQHSGNVDTTLKIEGKILGFNNKFKILASSKEIVYLPDSFRLWLKKLKRKFFPAFFLIVLIIILNYLQLTGASSSSSYVYKNDLKKYISENPNSLKSENNSYEEFIASLDNYKKNNINNKPIESLLILNIFMIFALMIILAPNKINIINRIPRKIKLNKE
ncbi:MAG: hypothetical protein WC139_11740 [Candidatus Kapaibacterium sp.]